MQPLILWDFNGTILDDVSLGIRAVNRMLAARGLAVLPSVEAYQAVFGFPIIDYYRRLGFDFSVEPYEKLAVEWVENYTREMNTLRLNEGFREAWAMLRKAGARQSILSSSEREMLRRQLSLLGIEDCFTEIYALDNIYAGGKAEMARLLLGETQEEAYLIGDTPHDADTARAIGARCVLYSGGHAARSTLETYGFPVVDQLTDAARLILDHTMNFLS